VKIQSDPQRVYDRIVTVSQSGAAETLELVKRKLRALPMATGELAASYRLEVRSVSDDGVEMALVSDAAHAAVIERGGSGKGRHILRDTTRREWGRQMARDLRT
jgi:hypothetical protein